MVARAWTASEIGGLSGRVAVITGANSGIGLATATELACHGAVVVLACRDLARAGQASRVITQSGAEAECVRVVALDLASLASVREAAEEILALCPRLDLLINNAGVMTIPFALSEDGVELTFATNHLGHFALTGLLLDRLLATPSSRVVTVSSNAHRRGQAQFYGLSSPAGYDAGHAYERSKLANLLFTFELQRRLESAHTETIAVAAHPGNARTELWRTSSWLERLLLGPRLRWLTGGLAQSPASGALPTLRAATDPAVAGADYYGPSGRFGYTGPPVRVSASPDAHDPGAQRRLWEVSEQLSGVTYQLPTAAASR
jgi:protochlorophyllide reductase